MLMTECKIMDTRKSKKLLLIATCSKTGIKFETGYDIPAMVYDDSILLGALSNAHNVDTNKTCVYSNVEFCMALAKNGTFDSLAELTNEVLAGILITLGFNKDLLVTHDSRVDNNRLLQKASTDTLVKGIKLFYNTQARRGKFEAMPQLDIDTHIHKDETMTIDESLQAFFESVLHASDTISQANKFNKRVTPLSYYTESEELTGKGQISKDTPSDNHKDFMRDFRQYRKQATISLGELSIWLLTNNLSNLYTFLQNATKKEVMIAIKPATKEKLKNRISGLILDVGKDSTESTHLQNILVFIEHSESDEHALSNIDSLLERASDSMPKPKKSLKDILASKKASLR